MSRPDVPRIQITVDQAVEPSRVAAALRARFAGHSWATGPESRVADAVTKAVAETQTARANQLDSNPDRGTNRRTL
ncbi:MAG: hypothetical protein ACRBK7_17460 [Acidimicrobiales bacterium]